MTEHAIQNKIRNALTDEGLFFRANVGRAWTGSKIERLTNGRVLIHDARPFDTGLPAGFSDLFGLTPLVIEPQHIGQTIGRFAAIEIKGKHGRASDRQKAFLTAIQREGGIAGTAWSVEDALNLIRAAK